MGLKHSGSYYMILDWDTQHFITTITSHAVDLKLTERGTAHIRPVFICSLLSEAVRT